MIDATPRAEAARPTMGFVELVAFLAIIMALNALAIDVVLPGLPALGDELGVAGGNQRQLVIVVYLIGMGASQLVYGALADRIGRRPTLLLGLGIYGVAGLASAVAPSFGALLIARVAQGLGAGSPRVVAVSIARDRYRGSEMAQVMSLVTMVFMVVPVLAPSIGQGILWVASWRWIFGVLAVAGALVAAWAGLRLAETLPPEHRRSLSPRAVARGLREVLTTRATAVPMVAMALTHGVVMAFVTSAQQVYQETFDVGAAFPLWFALIALTMSVAAFGNARLVRTLGPAALARRALHVMIATAGIMAALAATDHLGLAAYEVLACVVLMGFGFVGSNLNALAMESMGHLAGTASSVLGAVTTISAALFGGAVGHLYDGTALPLALGVLGLALLARATLWLAPSTHAG
ncbi:MAG: multidrug effflux MFS transporter [Myxococcales bacterium]|nr:multidrug effflux MFS transporter [Myxococcales bacterium]MBK7196817.1 multidrug effflux MFS transporter [Myxococcales bacterium]MBP6844841.1 multidrug effflux MFS transporter [Kofleriaceae bacterium]